jgi:hypothetical protein
MAMRSFTDDAGVEWRVWATQPGARAELYGDHAQGWLTFECATGSRRLAPIPQGWEEVSTTRLQLMSRVAKPVTRRTTPQATAINDLENESRKGGG